MWSRMSISMSPALMTWYMWSQMSLLMSPALTTQYNDIEVSVVELDAPVGDRSMKAAF